MHYPKNFDRHLIKRIEVEQKFADNIYKEFRAKRYGLAACCSLDQMDKYKIKKELCDWNDLKLKTYSSTTYEELNFYPIPENNPDLFDTITTTTETTTPITTYETTITVQGDPIWVLDDCKNNCVYPPTYKPTNTQLKNSCETISGGETVCGSGVLNMNNGRNSILKFTQQDLEFIPNNSGNAEVTLYSKITVNAYLNELAMQDPLGLGYVGAWTAISDWYESGFTEETFFNTLDMPPASAYYDWQNNGVSEYFAVMAQFRLVPAPNAEGPQSGVKLAWRYKDPILQASDFGNNIWEPIVIDGETYFTGAITDPSYSTTLFGNEKFFKQSLNNQNNWYALNGGFYYAVTQGSGQSMMRAVVKDGYDVYQTDFISEGNLLMTGMADPSIYYITDSELAGSFLGTESLAWEQPLLWEPLSSGDLRKPVCSFSWGIGTVTNGENIGLNGNIIESGILDSECTYLGIETFEEEIITVTEGGETITETVIKYECKTDNEYIVFKVYNQLGDPVEGYDIIINGGNTGKTNENGIFKTIIENASVKTKHTLNICHCFTTTGACTQKEIKIIVNDDDISNITIDKINCTPISPSE
jgi:hypothetical protein